MPWYENPEHTTVYAPHINDLLMVQFDYREHRITALVTLDDDPAAVQIDLGSQTTVSSQSLHDFLPGQPVDTRQEPHRLLTDGGPWALARTPTKRKTTSERRHAQNPMY